MSTNHNSTRKRKTSRKHGKSHKKVWIVTLGLLALIMAGVLAYALPVVVSEAGDDAIIKIPAGATSRNVEDSLAKYLGEKYAGRVMRVANLDKIDFSKRHGAYLIPKGTSPLRAERRLTRGAQQPLTITVNGFRSLDRMAQRIAARLDFPADSLIKEATNPEFLAVYGLTPGQALAFFLDDSYEVYWSTSPEALLKKMGDNYNRVWNKTRRDKAAALGLTPVEISIVSSITDEETNKTDEKGQIGRLYINRLEKGMPLQADPTIRFALNDFTIRRVKGNHLKVDSPYNTYLNRGLPPGPIRTTSVTTIDKILDSAPSDHLYMCAKEDFSGYHNFASSYSEHQANALRYRKALDSRGIK